MSNFLLVNGTASDGAPVGVSPSMATALAEAIGAGVAHVVFDSAGEVADAVKSGAWDIGNIGADAARAEFIAFTAPYVEIESTYIVRGDSAFTEVTDVDRPGVRIVTKARAAYSLWLERNITRAELIQVDNADDAFDRFADGSADVLAGLRPRLLDDSARVPSGRLLDGRFTSVQQAIGVPRDRDPAGLAYLDEFVRAAIGSGFVADLIGHHGATGLSVASAR